MWPKEQGRYAYEWFYDGLRHEIRNPLKYLMGRLGGTTYTDLIDETWNLENLTLLWELIHYSRELIGQAGRVTRRTSGVTCKSRTIKGANEMLYAYNRQLLESYTTYHLKSKWKTRATDVGKYVLIHTLEGGKSTSVLGVKVCDTYTQGPLGKGNIHVIVQNMTPDPIYVLWETALEWLTEVA